MNCTSLIRTLLMASGAIASAASPALHAASAARSAEGQAQDPAQETQQGGEAEEFLLNPLNSRELLRQGGRQVRVGGTQFVYNDKFEFASANDLFLWGWLPTISGDIGDNAFLGGQKVDISAEAQIGGDVFLFAQTSTIAGHIVGDLYAFVGDLTIQEGATIDGAIYGSSGALEISGDVGGPLHFAAGAVVLDGRVRGDVRLEAGELELGPNAVIEGELRYESAREATVDPGATVVGETRYFVPRADDDDEDDTGVAGGWWGFWGMLWIVGGFLSSFLVGAIALALGGDSARRPSTSLGAQPALGLGFGFVVAVVFPAAAILAMVLVVTLPLGLILLALYAAATYLASLVAALALGEWLFKVGRSGSQPSAYASLAAGLVVFAILIQIPYVGFLIWLAAIVGGLGGIFLATRRSDADGPSLA